MKVMKFGGGCLRRADDFRAVAAIVAKECETPLVVVSAAHGVTDRLLALSDQASHSRHPPLRLLQQLGHEHLELASALIQEKCTAHAVTTAIEKRMTALQLYCRRIACIGKISPSLQAVVLSFGERLAALLLAGILAGQGRRAVGLDSDRIGIVAAGTADNATILADLTRRRLRLSLLPCLRQGIIPVVTGFFARDRSHRVVLLGRNGSDYSAAAIAAAIGADQLEIWKDVDGFMSADPKMVKTAQRLDRLSYAEASELSYFGATILHPRTVESLASRPIPIAIRNLHRPESPGTIIQATGPACDHTVKGVTCTPEVTWLRFNKPGVGQQPGVIAHISRRMDEQNTTILALSASPSCLNLLIDNRRALPDRFLRHFENNRTGRVELLKKDALVAVVSEGFRQRSGLTARAMAALAAQRINAGMISAGVSAVACTFIVRREFMAEAVATLHREFFGG